MNKTVSWHPTTSEIPRSAGVYRFRDAQGRVLYVGKAKNLRVRLTNYFQDPAVLHPRTAQMVGQARSVQWTVVTNEIEALTLEYQWIKQFQPRFNVMYRDDKSYPYLSVSMGEKFPRVAISRDAKRLGSRYFGPYTKVWVIRETIDLLLPTFPIRSCTAGVLRRAQAQGRPCLLGYIDRCSAPCVERITEKEHRQIAENLCSFMDGETGSTMSSLSKEMRVAASNMDFELAAKKRDQLEALEKIQEKNAIALSENVDADLFALVSDDLDAAVHAFYVRGGRIRGTQGWVIEKVDDRSEQDLMHDLIEQVYVERIQVADKKHYKMVAPTSVDDVEHLPVEAVPNQILVSTNPTLKEDLQKVLGELRKTTIRVPKRGPKAALMGTVTKNAEESLKLYKTRRSADLTQRAQSLDELMKALGLQRAPLRIECFDVSHTGGEHRVASMVVFEDGLPRKDAYRMFNVSEENGGNRDDTAAMHQVIRRRFKHYGTSNSNQVTEKNELTSGKISSNEGKVRRFAYDPELIVVDGGLPQVNAAHRALVAAEVDLPVIGLAERLEQVWFPHAPYPTVLPRTSSSLHLLQHLRDESHRFALTKHRKKRLKAQTRSALDAIPGLGAVRQTSLLKHFGSVKRIREATVEQIAQVPGFGKILAQQVHDKLSDPAGTS